MDTEKYKALLCVIEEGGLSAAAEKLGYTPSGISRMMATLEDDCGFQLLYRSHDGAVPTEECAGLLPYIRELVYSGENVKQFAQKIRKADVGTLTLGTAYSVYYDWLSETASAFHRLYPLIQIRITGGYSSELMSKIKMHKLDVAIISWREENGVSWMPVREDEMVAAVPAGHALAKQKSVPVEAFSEEVYIDTYPECDIDNEHVFQHCGVHPDTQFSTMDIQATFSMVRAGLGISMHNALNCRKLDESIKILPLEPPQKVSVGLAASENMSPACKTFMKFISRDWFQRLVDV